MQVRKMLVKNRNAKTLFFQKSVLDLYITIAKYFRDYYSKVFSRFQIKIFTVVK